MAEAPPCEHAHAHDEHDHAHAHAHAHVQLPHEGHEHDERAAAAAAAAHSDGEHSDHEQEPEDEKEDPTAQLDIDCNADTIQMHGLRIANISSFQLHLLTNVRTLSLHRNLLHKVDPLPPNCHALTDLCLSDNKIKRIPEHLMLLTGLTRLDLSYNNLRKIEHLDTLTGLAELYLQSNKLPQIENLQPLTNLRLLELGANRFREVTGLETLTNLTSLYLGKNKIAEIKGIDQLRGLRVLSFQCNRITEIKGLETLQALDELYISENGIKRMEGLNHAFAPALRVLDLSTNFMETIVVEELQGMRALEEFWFNDNKITDWREVEKLQCLPQLNCIYMRHNPIFSDPRYRSKLVDLLPGLTEIDSLPVVRPR